MANRQQLAVITSLILATTVTAASAQSTTPYQFGIVPNGSYENYHVDAVNMANGNDIIKIPLFSLPQLGKLSLSVSIVSNTSTWQPDANCPTDSSACTSFFYSPIDIDFGALFAGTGGMGPSIVVDNIPGVNYALFPSEYCYSQDPGNLPDTCDTYETTLWTVYDGSGGAHPLYYNAADYSPNIATTMRTTDGSGLLYRSGYQDPARKSSENAGNWSGEAILTDSRGVQNKWDGLYTSEPHKFTQADLNGNKITISSLGYPDIDGDLVDTVGRTIPSVPQATTENINNSGCPNINDPLQPLVSYAVWQVPAPNNTIATYIICYTEITIRTNFFNCHAQYPPFNSINQCPVREGADEDGNPIMANQYDFWNPATLIQSIVLPDGSYWGFTYDAADPNNNSDVGHYGTLSKLISPVGGSISYSYGRGWGGICDESNPGPGSITVAGRTISDGKGNIYQYSYYAEPNNYADVSRTGRNVSTDPNGNDTVYEYSIGHADCGNELETARKTYQGPLANGKLLRTVETDYQTAYAPGYGGPATFITSYGNALPKTVTTTLDNGFTSTTTNTYSTVSFSAVMPTCVEDSGPCESLGLYPSPLVLGIPLSSSTTDYSSTSSPGGVLSSSTTQYLWQYFPDYLTENLLTMPYISTISDGNSDIAAQATTIPDETTYTSAPAFAGNPTTVSRLNNNGSSVQTRTAWTKYGMIDHTVDGNGNTSAQYEYGSSPCSPSYASAPQSYTGLYPTKITNALGEVTQYTWDCNTGQVASVTDPNGVSTTYSYDDVRGRPVQVDSAVGTSAESLRTYKYPSQTEVDVTQDQNTKGDGLLKWVTQADGLGRIVHRVSPNGAQVDTKYDGLDQVLSVSNPYFSSQDSTYGFTSYAYDALGRKTYACNPDNGTGSGPCTPGISYRQWSYSGNTTTFTDELGNSSTESVDALGRLTNVTESGGQSTGYGYDSLGNLVSVDQKGLPSTDTPRQRTFLYDSLSRLIASNNPENSGTFTPPQLNCVPTRIWTTCYTYDANGNLLTKRDNRNITTTYSYDPLNRLTGKSYSGADPSTTATAASCYQYDDATSGSSVPYAVGRLLNEWTQPTSCTTPASLSSVPSAALNWKSITAYDPLGRLQSDVQCPLAPCSASNAVAYTYNLAGDLTSSTNGVPSSASPGILATYSYDSASRLSKLSSSWDDATHPGTLFEADQTTQALFESPYGPFGLINAQLGVSSQTPQQTSMLLSRAYDNRARVTNINVLGVPASSASSITARVSPFPYVALGVTPIATTSCTQCGDGSFQWYIDNAPIGGGYHFAADVETGPTGSNLALGTHSFYVSYSGDATHPAMSSTRVQFTVVPDQLPATTLTAQVTPVPVPLGESGLIDFTLICNAPCTTIPSGSGYFTVDGAWAGGFTLDDDGTAENQVASTLSAGAHTLMAYYLGDGQYADSSYSGTFTVAQESLPSLGITLTVAPSPVPANEYAAVSITSNCSANCGGGHLFVDGNYAGGFDLDANGSSLVDLFPAYDPGGSFMTPGQHTITTDYMGNSSYAPSNTTATTFTIVSNNLPVPVVTASVTAKQISSGQPSIVNVHVSCAPSCSSQAPSLGGGFVFVDGNYAGGYMPDSNGDGILYLQPGLSAGSHSLIAQYYGNLSYTYANSAPVSFTLTN